jgi:hypothetical protein
VGPNVNHHNPKSLPYKQWAKKGSKSLLKLHEPNNVQCKTQVA